MSGSATFTIVTSSRSMKTPVQTATSVHHLRSIGESLLGRGEGSDDKLLFQPLIVK